MASLVRLLKGWCKFGGRCDYDDSVKGSIRRGISCFIFQHSVACFPHQARKPHRNFNESSEAV
jgi:hypothetical protein